MKILSFLVFVWFINCAIGQISVTAFPATYSNNFNNYNPNILANVPSTINNTGTGTNIASSTIGWSASSSATATFNGQGTGSSTTGGYWGFGTGSDYSLGALRSGTPGNLTYTVTFINNTGCPITDISLGWNYEQWRYSNTSGWNCSGTGALSGNSVLNANDFAGISSGTNGSVTTTSIPTFTLTGLSIADGATFGVQWTTTDITNADNGISIDDFSISISGSCSPPTNSISTGTVSTSPFSISCLSGTIGTVSFTSTGTYNPGNVFTAQLSNAAGTFSSPITIGSLDSTSSVGTNLSGTINFTIPAGTPSGGGYQIRVISSNPAITGSESTAFTITLADGPCASTPPYITSVIINSCNPTCTEGYNELVFGNTGDYSVTVNTSNFDISYGSTYPLINYTDVLTTNSTTTAQINTVAGCPGAFIDGVGTTLPPGSSFILAPTQLCEEALQWSGLCAAAPIYIIYQNDPSWMLGGTFKNGNTGGVRYFNSTITTTAGETFSIDYNYNSTLLQTGAAGDGEYVSFGPDGGSATYGDNNCILSPVLLPSTTVNFKGIHHNGKNYLTWATSSEQNNDYFTIYHSVEGFNYNPVGQVQGTGNSNTEMHYSFVHDRPSRGINYYKLTSTDYDGTTYNKGIVSVMADSDGIFFDPVTSLLMFGETGNFEVFTAEGKMVATAHESATLYVDRKGLLLVRNLRSGKTDRVFIP
jgi:hypothetical protein